MENKKDFFTELRELYNTSGEEEQNHFADIVKMVMEEEIGGSPPNGQCVIPPEKKGVGDKPYFVMDIQKAKIERKQTDSSFIDPSFGYKSFQTNKTEFLQPNTQTVITSILEIAVLEGEVYHCSLTVNYALQGVMCCPRLYSSQYTGTVSLCVINTNSKPVKISVPIIQVYKLRGG